MNDASEVAIVIECIGPATSDCDPCGSAVKYQTKLISKYFTIFNSLDMELYPGDLVRVEREQNRISKVDCWYVKEYLGHERLITT